MTEDPLQPYRQPMVTATGLILGFTLNFAAIWVQTENPLGDLLAYFIGTCVLIGTILLIVVMVRMLTHNYPRVQADEYYGKTRKIFVFGICTTFLGVFIDMFVTVLTL